MPQTIFFLVSLAKKSLHRYITASVLAEAAAEVRKGIDAVER